MEESNELYGLSSKESKRRLEKYGLNQLKKNKKVSRLRIFLEQFNDFITWVLIGATIISGLMGESADAITILIIVVINALLGFIQEYKTEKSLEALNKLAAPTAKVVRDGRIQIVNAKLIVPGDVAIIESGDRIPADGFLLEASGVLMDESLLTGESIGVEKKCSGKASNVFMGTTVLTGKGYIKVSETGMNTEMGKIAYMLQNIEVERSPLKERLNNLGKILVVLCIAICIAVTMLGIARGQDKYQMFLLGVSLAVAAIPEGLAAIVTVALALGVSRMLKRNALVRKLPAVETLGCTSIICSDKTGTLTQNNMTVVEMYFDGEVKKGADISKNLMLKKCFTYCNDCNYNFNEKEFKKCLFGDPTETALIKAFFENSKTLREFIAEGSRIFHIPFDSDRKMMSVLMKEKGTEICYVKGAPEKLLRKCSHILIRGEVVLLSDPERFRISKVVEEMSLRALRCIGGAFKSSGAKRGNQMEESLTFIGIAGIVDPPRKEAKEAVLKCKIASIKPVMITGDHKNTAFAIGKELDICKSINEVMTGEELDQLSDRQLKEQVDKYTIFARVNPKHKLRVVKAYKSKNNIVAMTGDGVNDAPAVKEADIGISMGISGTDVTKEASSMILLDDNFSTIVAAVEEGRVIYDNIRKFIRYLLSCNLGEVLTMFLSSLFYLDIPLLPIQILLINLATDGLPAIALGVDPSEDDVMYEKPRSKNESVFARGLKEKIILRGSLIGVCTILAFLIGKHYGMDLKTCRTLALCTLILSQLIHVFECRSEKHSIFEINILTNLYLVGAVFISISLLICVLYIPFLQSVFHTVALNMAQWFIILFFSGIIAFLNSMYLFFAKK
ncbi:MAG: calcium-translocating P-type ATPase, PMCA-type [Clostridiaceae bacterium]|nr:calcium-translocating P-type ATPase, PMCA-type [Clostridiaceae bacterium]